MNASSLTRDINLLKEESVQERTSPISPLYNAWAEIDLSAIRYNLAAIRKKLGNGSQILVVIKADAYGHGLKEVSRTVLNNGISWLGVTSIVEAMELRRLHPQARILILSAGMYAHSRLIVEHDLTPIVCSRQMVELLNNAGKEFSKKVRVHIKIDTGMGRLGAWYKNSLSFIKYISTFPYIELEGICTHFSSASSKEMDLQFCKQQLCSFKKVIDSAEKIGIHIPIKHIANSGAILVFKESYLDLVRTGISVYGLMPSPEFSCDLWLKPALRLKSRVAFIKDALPGRTISYGRTYIVKDKTKIATIPIGYSNGYSRSLSNKAMVLINGQYVPVLGIITMDQIMVDVGHIADVSVGDEVVLIGEQKGQNITATQVAQWAGTISYEILCKLNVPRVYFK